MTKFHRDAQKLILKRDFAKRLGSALSEAGYPDRGRQVMLANNMDVTQAAVRKWLIGQSTPSQEKQEELAKLLKVELNWLSHGRGSMSGTDQIKTGIPILAADQINQWLEAPEETLKNSHTIRMANPNLSLFALKQVGDAMATAKINSIPDGALLIIDTQDKKIIAHERYLIGFEHLSSPICREAVINEQSGIVFICSNPNEHSREVYNPHDDTIFGRLKNVLL